MRETGKTGYWETHELKNDEDIAKETRGLCNTQQCTDVMLAITF